MTHGRSRRISLDREGFKLVQQHSAVRDYYEPSSAHRCTAARRYRAAHYRIPRSMAKRGYAAVARYPCPLRQWIAGEIAVGVDVIGRRNRRPDAKRRPTHNE